MSEANKTITLQEFLYDFENVILNDVTDYQDCVNAWNAAIGAYIEDNIISEEAWNWKNPFLKRFEK